MSIDVTTPISAEYSGLPRVKGNLSSAAVRIFVEKICHIAANRELEAVQSTTAFLSVVA